MKKTLQFLVLSAVVLSLVFAGCAGAKTAQGKAVKTQAYTWKSVIAGGGGFIPGIIYHPAEKGLVYLRTDMGGAYKWDNENKEWKCITDMFGKDQSEYNGILSIGLDPNDPNKVYMMTGKYTQDWAGKGAFQISNDKGDTWKTIPLPFKVGGNENGRGCGERVAVDPNLGSIIFMGTTKDGLWKSADSGETWAKVTLCPEANINFVIFDKSSGTAGSATNKIFVAAADNTTSVYMSADAGATWAPVAGQPKGLMALRADIAKGEIFMTFSDNPGPNGATMGAVWKYNTGTGVWTDMKAPEGSGGFSGISIDAKNPKHILISTIDRWAEHDDVFQSMDGGKTWKTIIKDADWDYSFAPYTDTKNDMKPHWIADVKIDPFDSKTAMWVTGYGLWASNNITSKKARWYFNDKGIEETVPLQIISPPSGARLFTAVGDVDGFRYEDSLDTAPPNRYSPPRWTTLSIACAWGNPNLMVKTFNKPPFGAFSDDNGVTWKDFGSYPPDIKRGGYRSIAISSDGKTIVWAPEKGKGWEAEKTSVYYSKDNGATWRVCEDLPDGIYHPIADTINPAKFYIYDFLNGLMWMSDDSGASFVKYASELPTQTDQGWGAGVAAAVPGIEGDIWIAGQNGGLFRSIDSGQTAQQIYNVDEAYRVGFGKAAPDGKYPAIYLWGKVSGVIGIFRSDDTGNTWIRINDDNHQYGWIHCITGDPRIYGRCYISAEGRGVSYGDIEIK